MKNGWLIWSHEHAAWWRPASSGYTTAVSQAGRYSIGEAIEICRCASRGEGVCWIDNMGDTAPNEVMVPCPELLLELWLGPRLMLHEVHRSIAQAMRKNAWALVSIRPFECISSDNGHAWRQEPDGSWSAAVNEVWHPVDFGDVPHGVLILALHAANARYEEDVRKVVNE